MILQTNAKRVKIDVTPTGSVLLISGGKSVK